MKYYGKIGFVDTQETTPGVWEEVVTERYYYGDVTRNIAKWQSANQLNDDRNISNQISIVADPFAYEHFHKMRFIEWMGSRWKISDIEVQFPRLNLSIGGVYNGSAS